MRLAALCLAALLATPAIAEPASIRYAVIDGTVHWKSSDPATSPDTLFAIASVGKAFTAVAVLRLVDQGLIDLDTTAATYLAPQDRYQALQGITVRQLLTMTSGLQDYYDEAIFEAMIADQANAQTAAFALEWASDLPHLFAPGTDYDYSNTNYLILGMILEQVTGRSYAEVITDEVLTPAGITDSFVMGSRPLPESFAAGHPDRDLMRLYYSGEGFGDGGILANAADLARFYTALLDDRTLLPPETLEIMLTDAIGADYGMGLELSDGLIGHSGADVGYSADIRLEPGTGDLALELVAAEDSYSDWPYVTPLAD
jgi:D-alanyl-D-alanine carboxypeptidase